MTLFGEITGEPVFAEAIEKACGGETCQLTINLLGDES
jgi:hypothetical protein